MWKPIILDVECIVCNKSLQKFKHNPGEVTRKMGKITNNRRSRTPNWSLQEKQHLLNLIKARKEVVVTKSNNGPNYSEEKDIAWNEILSELAAKFGNKFIGSTIKKVKTQWQNMKRIAREEIAVNRLEMHKYTKISLEVCHILELFKDGVFNTESEHLNETMLTTDVEIKTECLDEDSNQQENSSISNNSLEMDVDLIRENNINPVNQFNTAASTMPSTSINQQNNVSEIAQASMSPIQKQAAVKDAGAMTDSPFPDISTYNSFQKELKEFLNYSAEEKAIKLEALKEERQVIRAMRETAELNKITAEQRLKHMLWVKKHESSMYSGEPGSGAGRGGGSGGAIRDAGGAFGKMEAAREDQYFYQKQKEQLANLKGHLDKEISFHQDQIKRHEDAIRRHKEQMANIEPK